LYRMAQKFIDLTSTLNITLCLEAVPEWELSSLHLNSRFNSLTSNNETSSPGE
jgi:hypothetical protein